MNSIKKYYASDAAHIELMAIHKIISSFDCSLVYPPSKYLFMSNGLKYRILFSKKHYITIPSKYEPNYFIIIIPKYKDCLTYLCCNFNFYLISYEVVEDLIINKMFKKNFLHCVNSLILFDTELLISYAVKI